VFLINVPVALFGFLAVAVLVPDTKSELSPAIDSVGIVGSSVGLVCLTYGFIRAGEHGWGSLGALVPLMLGVAVIVAFFSWERLLEHRPAGEPLLDLSLFRSPSFLWGVILFTVLTLALIGLLFTMPQYFQGVLGASPEGSGVRLLPAVGGMLVALLPAARLARAIGAKLTVAAGFLILAIALGIGSTATLTTGTGFIAGWMALAGVGTGLTMATTASAALVELSKDRAGVGSGVLQALKNTGAPLGSAVLGSVLASTYVSHLRLVGLSPLAAHTVRQSIFGGIAVAHAMHSPPLLTAVRGAFVHGTDAALLVSMGIAFGGCVLSLLFLPSSGPKVKGRSEEERIYASRPEIDRLNLHSIAQGVYPG